MEQSLIINNCVTEDVNTRNKTLNAYDYQFGAT